VRAALLSRSTRRDFFEKYADDSDVKMFAKRPAPDGL
jgi:hypothetical protein